MYADYIKNLPADEFKKLVGLVLASQREVYGGFKTLTFIQLAKWHTTGRVDGDLWSDADLRHLQISGLICQIYQRIREECS